MTASAKKIVALALLALVTFASSSGAKAESIVQLKPVTLLGAPITFADLAFEPFDPSLGHLNQALFNVQLNLDYSVGTTGILDLSTGTLRPVEVIGSSLFQIEGLDWPFFFEGNMSVDMGGLSGTTFYFSSAIDMTWQSNETSDLVGFTMGSGSFLGMIADPLSSVTRSDYIANPLTSGAGLQTEIRSTWSVEALGAPIGPVTQVGIGSLELDYDYTPVSAVPEPQTYVMLLTGLGLMGFVVRRRMQAATSA